MLVGADQGACAFLILKYYESSIHHEINEVKILCVEELKMSLKRDIALSFATAVLGLTFISGGTVAYFNDTKLANNSFTTGLLELGMNKETIIQVGDIVPGDIMHGNFVLTNDGTVNIKEIILHSSYEVIDNGKANQDDDLGDHIKVKYLSVIHIS